MNLTSLTHINLFASLREQEIEQIISSINIRETCFQKGEILARQDEQVNRLIILLSGSVRAEMNDPTGRFIKIEDIKAPNPLAILFLFGENNRFPVQATANEKVTALIIPKQAVLRMLQINETLLKNYLDISANFAGRLSKKLNFMSFRTIRQKLSVYILTLSRQQQTDTVVLDQSKTAIADYFGVSRPSLERELSNMQTDGLIKAERRTITITNKRDLTRIIG